jgi:hypothetical protein
MKYITWKSGHKTFTWITQKLCIHVVTKSFLREKTACIQKEAEIKIRVLCLGLKLKAYTVFSVICICFYEINRHWKKFLIMVNSSTCYTYVDHNVWIQCQHTCTPLRKMLLILCTSWHRDRGQNNFFINRTHCTMFQNIPLPLSPIFVPGVCNDINMTLPMWMYCLPWWKVLYG